MSVIVSASVMTVTVMGMGNAIRCHNFDLNRSTIMV
jgi:hypothetical protein